MVAWFICPAILKAEPTSRFATFGEMKVHYVDNGAVGDEALVFVHGWTCDSGSWRAQLKAFADRRVTAVDLPGHGRSDKPHVDYTIPMFARAVEAVMRDAQVSKAVLIGHSMGAPVVREFYRLFPEKTKALVIVDGALRLSFSREQSERLIQQLEADYAGNAHRMVDGMLMPIADAEMRDQMRATMLATPEYVAISAMKGMADPVVYHIDPIAVPLLAVLAKSPFWTPDTEQFLRSLAPELEFHMLEGVSHFLMAERPDDFNRILRGFLEKHR
jgi:pimeloyl-ACP methyl ester carboxylesterase